MKECSLKRRVDLTNKHVFQSGQVLCMSPWHWRPTLHKTAQCLWLVLAFQGGACIQDQMLLSMRRQKTQLPMYELINVLV